MRMEPSRHPRKFAAEADVQRAWAGEGQVELAMAAPLRKEQTALLNLIGDHIMTRWFLPFALLVLAACSTTKPIPQSVAVDPTTDPTIVGAVDEAARQGSIDAEAAAQTGRRIGRVAGVFSAVLGGPRYESVDDMVDRYKRTRDAVESTSAFVGATKGATEGAERGFQLDLQFAELHRIEGIEVTRPVPDQIAVHLPSAPDHQMLADIAAVFAGRDERAIDIESADGAAFDLRESLIELGLPASTLRVQRNELLQGIVLRIRYRD